jgi:hypothetical protein
MKKLFLLSFILVVNLTFSQTERNKMLSTSSFNFTSVIEERNYSLDNNIIINDFGEVVKVDFSLPTNNSEGKFTVYETSENKLVEKLEENIFLTNVVNNQELKSFVSANYNDFINSIVVKMKLDNHIRFDNNFDKKIDAKNLKTFSKNNKLNSIAKLSYNDVEVIVGGLNLNMDKVYTSELDHTLRNSLNLLVINF